jgi:DNA polymerase-1
MPKKLSHSTSERLFLIDGMAIAYRAYYTFISRPLINSKGENTSAIFGFVNTLMKILEDEKPEHIAVCFDTREPTFRHKMYEPYKATREKMPEDMSSQMDKLKETVLAFNVPLLELPGYEADDIMGTLAKKAEKQGIITYLVTGDKDFMQLISPRIKMYKPGKTGNEWEILDEQDVKEKFGVTPERIIDVLGLIGDKSDNIPGVPGVGEKTAIPLVQQFGSIENIYKNLDKIPQKGLLQKLKENKEKAFLSKELVTINTNVPLTTDIHHLEAKPRDTKKLLQLFSELEFKSLIKKLSNTAVTLDEDIRSEPSQLELTDITTDQHQYHLITTEKEFLELISQLKKSKRFVFDTETTGTDPLRAEIVGLSFAIAPREAWYVPIEEIRSQKPEVSSQNDGRRDLFSPSIHNPSIPGQQSPIQHPKSTTHNLLSDSNLKPRNPNDNGFPLSFVLSSLAPIFADSSLKKIGQNIKYDMLVLASHGVKTAGVEFDTMVANYVLRPDGQHNLDALAAEHLKYKMISYDELTGSGRERKPLREVDIEKVAEYSAQDADIAFRLCEILKEKLEQQHLLKLCEDIEFPLISVLADMELAGVSLDVEYLADLSTELERMLENLTTDIYNLAEEKFNINSTQQLSKVLFEKLKLSIVRKTKTGFSTDVGVLETLRHEHPIIEKLLDYRQLQKLKSTYVDALPALINPRTKRLHTSFNQTVTATGRLSSSDPNLQNIPIRTEIGRRIRRAFIAGNPEMIMLSADYSQIELRIMAHISGDEGLRDAFLNGEDIHATTAAKVFGVRLDDVTQEMRRKAKEVNFGIMYGIGPFGLSTRLDITQTEAKEIIATYFERFPKVKQYISDTIATAKRDGYVSTLLGRRRYLPDINSKNSNVRGNAERQAINMPIQGTAADMIKLAMIKIHSRLKDEGIQAKMLLQVHDELVFEAARKEELKTKKLIAEEMKNALPLSVPIEVEIGSGKNWLEAH